jgi:hypothetical protein
VSYRNHWPPAFTFSGDPFGDYRGFGVRCVRDADEPCDPSTADCVADGPCVHPTVPGDLDAGVADALAQHDGSADADGGSDACSEALEPLPGPCWTEEAAPACPSGWPDGCEAKACACCASAGVEPLACSEPTLDISLALPHGGAPLPAGAEIEICEGFQGGTHLGVVVRAAGDWSGPQILAVRAAAIVDGLIVGCYRKDKLAATAAGGVVETPPLQIRFEPCTGTPPGPVLLRVRVDASDWRWGLVEVPLLTIDAIEGPTTAEGDGC